MAMQNRLSIQHGRWSFSASAFVLSIILGLAPVQVHAQAGDVDTRLSRMERDIETLSRSVYKGEKPTGAVPGSGVDANTAAMQSQMDDRLNRLEQDLRDLTGKVEEQGNAITQLKTQVDRGVTDLQTRVNVVEQKLGLGSATVNAGMPSSTQASTMPSSAGHTPAPITAAPSTTPAATSDAGVAPGQLALPPGSNEPAPASSPTVKPLGNLTNAADTGVPVVPSDDPTQAYENAITLLKQRDYGLAEKTLTDFLKNNPSHALTPNAKYWLGEAYFAQNKYEQAARVFAEGYQQFPKGPKSADNLLKLGLSLAAMNNKTDACVALQQIGKDFPNGASAVNTRAVQEIKRLKCGA